MKGVKIIPYMLQRFRFKLRKSQNYCLKNHNLINFWIEITLNIRIGYKIKIKVKKI